MTAAKLNLVGAAQGFNWLPVFVAIEQGLFDQAGLDVALQKVGGVDKATAAVLEGAAALAITPPEGAVRNFVDGGELRLVASNSNRLPMSLVARPGIQSIEGLRGKKIGTSSLTEGTAIYTQIMLAERGLSYPGDYEFALAGIHTARWEALKSGEIDAAPQPAPWNFLAADEGYPLLGEVSASIPEIIFASLIGRQTWLDDNRAIVTRLLRALSVAHDFVNDRSNDEVSARTFAQITTPDNPALAARGFHYMRDLGMWPTGMAAPDAALGATIDLMIRAGLLDDKDREKARGAFDPRYLYDANGA